MRPTGSEAARPSRLCSSAAFATLSHQDETGEVHFPLGEQEEQEEQEEAALVDDLEGSQEHGESSFGLASTDEIPFE